MSAWDELRPRIVRLTGEHGPSKAARMLGCDRTTLWRWESGAAKPSRMAISAIRRAVADATKGDE